MAILPSGAEGGILPENKNKASADPFLEICAVAHYFARHETPYRSICRLGPL
jgi:hypothetical protein